MASKREHARELPAAKRGGVPSLLKARWLATESVERISADELSVDEFRRRFASGSGTPVIVTGCASKWPALAEWRAERLAERFPKLLWRVSAACDMTFPDFLDYCAALALRPGSDPRPLYLFDRGWREKCPELRDELTMPTYFAEDLMGVLGEARRPSYSWITAGPPLSGSSFHIDPNANSAWNATVQGAKKWLLYPNGLPPAMDGDGLTQLSLVEWFADHYDDCPYARRVTSEAGGSERQSDAHALAGRLRPSAPQERGPSPRVHHASGRDHVHPGRLVAPRLKPRAQRRRHA